MKKIRLICLVLALISVAALLAGCAKNNEEENEKPKLPLSVVETIAGNARELDLRFFAQYDYVTLGSLSMPLYYFQLSNSDYSLSVGTDETGAIEFMLLSHSSGEEIYLFHKNPGKLDPNATPYVEDASSADIREFIVRMTEN